jgi:phage anti-repressor protein
MTNYSTDFDQNIALSLLGSDNEFPVDFELAWRWLEFTKKENAKRSLIECEFEEGQDFLVLLPNEENSSMTSKTSTRGKKEGRKRESIWLAIDCFKSWGLMCRNDRGKQIRKYFLDCERQLKYVNTMSPAKPLSLTNLEPSHLYRLMSYLVALDRGFCPESRLMEGIDPAYLDATVDAVQYAYHWKQCQVAEATKNANDVMRHIGWMPTNRQEIEQENKDVAEFAGYLKRLEAGKLGGIRRDDFDRFESQQAALAGGRGLALGA